MNVHLLLQILAGNVDIARKVNGTNQRLFLDVENHDNAGALRFHIGLHIGKTPQFVEALVIVLYGGRIKFVPDVRTNEIEDDLLRDLRCR